MENLLNKENTSWDHYSRLVLTKLDEHDDLLYDINKELMNIRVDIGMLKVKAGIWGLLGGAIPTIVAILLKS